MTISVISFTGRGRQLSRVLGERINGQSSRQANQQLLGRALLYTGERGALPEESVLQEAERFQPIIRVEDLAAWTGAQFAAHRALLFIGACGIAVRSIAPFIQNKLTDSPVLVMDEGGAYVIPILSGHAGGADRLANMIAECMGAVPVLTAATDINRRFAVDVFAQRQGLFICNRAGIGSVSGRILRGGTVTVAAEGMTAAQCRDWLVRKLGDCPTELVPVDARQTEVSQAEIPQTEVPPAEVPPADIWIGESPREGVVLWLRPKVYVLGMGCKKGKACKELQTFAKEQLERAGIAQEEIYALASIDRKRGEAGLWDLADSLRVPFLLFSAGELRAVQGEFTGSFFVEAQVGVDNVCERAALAGSSAGGSLVLGKTSRGGMTLAIARRDWTV